MSTNRRAIMVKRFEAILDQAEANKPDERLVNASVELVQLVKMMWEGSHEENYASFSPDTVWAWIEDSFLNVEDVLKDLGVTVGEYELDDDEKETLAIWQGKQRQP